MACCRLAFTRPIPYSAFLRVNVTNWDLARSFAFECTQVLGVNADRSYPVPSSDGTFSRRHPIAGVPCMRNLGRATRARDPGL